MREAGHRSGLNRVGALLLALLLCAGCSQRPLRPSDAHLRSEPPRAEGAIPPPVQLAPVVPVPKPAARPETYSVVVNSVRVQELLFALARDAKLNIDIHPGITGTVTLNALDQTLPQLLTRIAKQVDLRYELDGSNLVVMRDTPFLRSYKIDYLSAGRTTTMQSSASSQFVASGPGAAGGAAALGPGATGSNTRIEISSKNQLWESIVQNVKDILRETDKILPGAAAVAAPPAAPAPQPGQAAPGAPAPAVVAPEPSATYREAAYVIDNRESGILYVRATAKQHEKVQEFLDRVLASVNRQVLIEATVAEVQLNNQYQRGIDWSRLRTGPAGFSFQQISAGTQTPSNFVNTSSFIIGYAAPGLPFTSALTLLETFGDVRVLSSPKLSVLNNQTAMLRVTRDIVYFTITPSTTPITIAGSGLGGVTLQQSFTTTPNVAAEGFMMAVLPQINDADTVVLNVHPTIRRRIANATDPNPALTTVQNLIPIFETREFESILRVQSGQIAVLGGLMQDATQNIEETIPGVRSIPGVGQLLSQRRDLTQKTELVIFLRPTVIHDPSMDGDFAPLRGLQPDETFFRKPNPQRVDEREGIGARPAAK